MISKNFYKENNLIQKFLEGKVKHYPIKEPTVALTTWNYTVQYGDTMYTLAKMIFGVDGEYNWTIIADLNYLRQPDDLQPGEVIKLPLIVLDETRYNKVSYADTTSTTTQI